MVISRPRGVNDIGYRTIARPLMQQLVAIRDQVDLVLLRPPTLEALDEALGSSRSKELELNVRSPFDVVHFDGHGLAADRGTLVFERPGGGADYVPVDEVARV